MAVAQSLLADAAGTTTERWLQTISAFITPLTKSAAAAYRPFVQKECSVSSGRLTAVLRRGACRVVLNRRRSRIGSDVIIITLYIITIL